MMQPPGVTAAENLPLKRGLSTWAAVESAYTVASKVVDVLIAGWDEYQHQPPRVSVEATISTN